MPSSSHCSPSHPHLLGFTLRAGLHGTEVEGRSIKVELANGAGSRRKERSNVCYDWLKGTCARDNCRFDHFQDGDRDRRDRDVGKFNSWLRIINEFLSAEMTTAVMTTAEMTTAEMTIEGRILVVTTIEGMTIAETVTSIAM